MMDDIEQLGAMIEEFSNIVNVNTAIMEAQNKRILELEAENKRLLRENKALRANTSKSVLRRLDVQLEDKE